MRVSLRFEAAAEIAAGELAAVMRGEVLFGEGFERLPELADWSAERAVLARVERVD